MVVHDCNRCHARYGTGGQRRHAKVERAVERKAAAYRRVGANLSPQRRLVVTLPSLSEFVPKLSHISVRHPVPLAGTRYIFGQQISVLNSGNGILATDVSHPGSFSLIFYHEKAFHHGLFLHSKYQAYGPMMEF